MDKAFNPWDELQRYQADQLPSGQFGATASFVGSMRDFLDNLCDECRQKYQLDDCLIIHRFGDIRPGEPIVLTVAWSAHRAQAFDACRYLMEELKARAPFWKKEQTDKGERWVHNELKKTMKNE